MTKKKRDDCDEDEDEYEPQGGREYLSGFKEHLWVQAHNKRELIINFPITDSTVELITLPIMRINAYDDTVAAQVPTYERAPITVYISTDGGSIDAAFSVVGAIEASRTPVHTIALAKAYSAGFLMLIAGHKRSCQRYSLNLLHQGAAGYIGKFADIEEYSAHFMRTQERIHEFVIRRTKIDADTLNDAFRTKYDWYMDAVEAYELGVVDEIIGVDMDALDKALKPKRSHKKKPQ